LVHNNDVVLRHTVVLVLTSAMACGSGPNVPRPRPQEQALPPPPRLADRVPIDAGVPDAPAVPRLACDPGTTLAVASPPEPTWFCARPDGTRHGPFVTAFPDGTPEITGAYVDGVLDGAWQRRAPSGTTVEAGHYLADQRTGQWTQTSATGEPLGAYQLVAGTGVEKRWLDDGTLYSERAVRAGVPHGAEKRYAPDGTVVVSAQWTAGKLDGPHAFGTRATLRMEQTFIAGVRRGVRLIWQAGHLLLEEAYDRDGRLHGPYTIWRNKTVMRVHGELEHGRRDGLWTWNDRDGNKEREGNYIAGKRDGPWTEWYENKTVFTGEYTRGKPDGDFIYYDRNQNELGRFAIQGGTGTMLTFWGNRKVATRQRLDRGSPDGRYQELTSRGQLVVEGRFRGDARHGAWKEWSPEGVVTLEQSWRRGRLDGAVKKYVAGQLATSATYQDGKVTGVYTELRDGKPAVTGQFVDDRRAGTWTTYGRDGRVTLIATYKDGVLDGPWHQLVDGVVIEGTLTQGRRTGTWTRTDRAGATQRIIYPGG
jgi:antitoxin component YwqK of YwqJK toxin-antitoxin module